MNYKDIKVNTINEYNTFIFNNQEIKVLKYLPIEEKFDLIMSAIQKSVINGNYNPIRLQTFFELHIVYLYTNIDFDMDDRLDEGALYDNLVMSGLLSQVMSAMEESEMLLLSHYFHEAYEAEKTYRHTAASMITKLVDDLPKNAEAAKNMVDTFEPEKFQQVLNFAKSINNGQLA